MRFVFAFLLITLLIVSSMADTEKHEWAVELNPSANADEIAANHGFDNMGRIGNLPNHYLFKLQDHHARSRDVAMEKGNNLAAHEEVVWSEKQVPRKMVKKPHNAMHGGVLKA